MLVVAALLAALAVTFVSIDLGRVTIGDQNLVTLAEKYGSEYLESKLEVGRIEALLWPGRFRLTDVVIAGKGAADVPFLTAKSITVQVEWYGLWRREVLLEVRMRDWTMSIERWADGKHTVPRLTPKGTRGPSRWATTMRHLHGEQGTFLYRDHGTPWRVASSNLSFDVVKTPVWNTYVGQVHFADGTVGIQKFQPMGMDMTARFRIDGSKVTLPHIDLVTDGAVSHVTGALDFKKFSEQTYFITSDIDFATMRQIFFTDSTWDVDGRGRFTGVFQLFQDGRNLAGDFASDLTRLHAGGTSYRFPNLRGHVQWLPDRLLVERAEADLEGGRAVFSYGLAPLGRPGGAGATFAADYEGVDLERLTSLFDMAGLRLAGRASGHVDMVWPNGRFSTAMTGHGDVKVAAPEGATMATEALPPSAPEGPASTDMGALPVAGDLSFTFEPGTLIVADSWAATRSTFVRMRGQTDYGSATEMPFRVTSHDWQESDRVLVAIMNAFGRKTGTIEVGGRGTFDGVMTRSFGSPIITGKFDSHGMTAWGVTWGRARGDLMVADGFVTIANSLIGDSPERSITANGKFALGFPGGEEINATIGVTNWPMADMKHAFGLDTWPVDATIAKADLTLRGPYRGPFGTGTLRLERGVAWGESFPLATGELAFEGTGLRVNRIDMTKGTGAVRGAAWIGWDGRYSFDADGDRIPVEVLDRFKVNVAPLTGLLKFRAEGAGEFTSPQYQFEGTIADLSVGDEGVGLVRGRVEAANNILALDISATSSRLDITGNGTIALNDASDADLRFRFFETSVDPYLKFYAPEVSPYARIIASGSLRVSGPLADATRTLVETTVDAASVTLLDYALANDGPVVLRFADNAFRVERLQLKGINTALAVTGDVNRTTERVDLSAKGQANLAILQLFLSDVESNGDAAIDAQLRGPFDRLALTGQAVVSAGSIRHFALPHSLSDIRGPIRFDATGVDVSGLRGRMGRGDVTFGGRITLRDGYRPEEFNVTADGRSMQLRYPEGFSSLVNASLELRGPVSAPLLTGDVEVLQVTYRPPFDQSAGLFGLAGGATVGGPAEAAETSAAWFPLAFDVRLRVPTMPLIDTGTAQITGSANLDFTGTLNRPSLTGRIDLESGTVDFLGNRYTVLPGTIEFTEAEPFQPVFDVQAETRTRSGDQPVTVTARLTGSFERLRPTLNSEPFLPTSDIVTLIFGGVPDVRSVEQRLLSPTESQQLMMQTAGAALLLSPISSRVEGVLRNTLGIDTAQVTPQLYSGGSAGSTTQRLNPSARLLLGQRIGPSAYLTYSRLLGDAREEEIIRLEYEQNRRVSWILTRNEDRSFSVEVRYRVR